MSDNKIRQLKGPDRIRKRPAVVFGAEDIRGARQVVVDLLHIFATEAQLGHCRQLSVEQNHGELSIRGDDRGIVLGGASAEDAPWQRLFEDFYCPPTNMPGEEGLSFGLQSGAHRLLYGDPVEPESTLFPDDTGYFELYCAQCACRFMDVQSRRKGLQSSLHFEGGYNIGGLKTEPTEAPDGTSFHFALDDQVFTETILPGEFLTETLNQLAMLCPGLVCTYRNDAGERIFAYPGGIADYVRLQAENPPVFYKKLQGKAKERYNTAEYEARVEIAVAFARDHGGVLCLHNFRPIPLGGTHYRQMEKQILDGFQKWTEQPLTFNVLSRHLSIVLVSWCAPWCTRWENGTRLAITNRVIRDMTQDALSGEFRNFLHANQDEVKTILNKTAL